MYMLYSLDGEFVQNYTFYRNAYNAAISMGGGEILFNGTSNIVTSI